jgi:diphthamide synthase (EF-2-diphthine--ammonia ligase)
MARAKADGVTHVVFGDLFLEDVRSYRERQLARAGMAGVYPLWGRETGALLAEMLAAGVEAWVTCVDPRQAPAELAGKMLTPELMAALPASVDRCFERGEAHTFAANGPAFARRVDVRPGVVVERDGFVFADLVAAPS